MKKFSLIILFMCLLATPAFPSPALQPQPYFYFGANIDRNIILVEITYLNKRKEIGILLNEDSDSIWIMTEKGMMGMRFKNQIFKIDILRIKDKKLNRR